jgi:hypothetical protein
MIPNPLGKSVNCYDSKEIATGRAGVSFSGWEDKKKLFDLPENRASGLIITS